MEGEAMPMEGAPAEGGGEQEAAGALGELVNNVGQGLQMIADLVGKTSDAPPEAAQIASGLLDGFSQLLNVMGGGGGPQAASQQMPANANSGARPMPPGMG